MTQPGTSGLEYALAQVLNHHTGQRILQTHPRSALFVRRRAKQYGFAHPIAFLSWITSDPNAQQELDALIDLTINGLTAFYRGPAQLDAAQTLMRQWTSPDPMRIWSAGCSTGEEAYTLSMLARRCHTPCLVLGTDINRRALARASQATYSAWSMRRMSPDDARAFMRADVPNQTWRVRAGVRADVRFEYHHLLRPAPLAPGGRGWDVILCRNVFIYFDERARARALDHLMGALAPEGRLILGTSEGGIGHTHGLHSERLGQGIAHRPGVPTRAPRALSNPQPAPAPDVSSWSLGAAVDLAMKEDLEGAVNACVEMLRAEPLDQDTLYLLGLLWRALGERQRAQDTFRQVLFLEPNHWLAAYELAQVWAQRGDASRARALHQQMHNGLRAQDAPDPFTPALAKLTQRTLATQRALCASLTLDALLALSDT